MPSNASSRGLLRPPAPARALLAVGAGTADTSKAFKVALLSPGPVSDAGWNALAYEGLLAIRDQLGAEIAQVETKTPASSRTGSATSPGAASI